MNAATIDNALDLALDCWDLPWGDDDAEELDFADIVGDIITTAFGAEALEDCSESAEDIDDEPVAEAEAVPSPAPKGDDGFAEWQELVALCEDTLEDRDDDDTEATLEVTGNEAVPVVPAAPAIYFRPLAPRYPRTLCVALEDRQGNHTDRSTTPQHSPGKVVSIMSHQVIRHDGLRHVIIQAKKLKKGRYVGWTEYLVAPIEEGGVSWARLVVDTPPKEVVASDNEVKKALARFRSNRDKKRPASSSRTPRKRCPAADFSDDHWEHLAGSGWVRVERDRHFALHDFVVAFKKADIPEGCVCQYDNVVKLYWCEV